MERYLCRKEVMRRLRRSRSSLRRDVQAGRIPAPVNPSGKPKGQRFWPESEIAAHEQRLRDERGEPDACD